MSFSGKSHKSSQADDDVKDGYPQESRLINDDEQKAITELKSRFTVEELAGVPEVRFITFVRGYWNEKDRAEHTYKMLKRALEYRKEIGADDMLYRKVDKDDVYLKLFPFDYHKCDKRGHMIYYERTAYVDPTELTTKLTEKEIEENHVQMLEVLMYLKQKKSEEIGALSYKSIVIMDLQDFGWKHLSSSLYGAIKKILTIDQYYYPETLYKLFIINAPLTFRTLWAVIKPWLHPVTQSRIQIAGGQKDFLPRLQELVDDESIPCYLGGACKCCDPKGAAVMIDKLYERNTRWREERIKEREEKMKNSADGSA